MLGMEDALSENKYQLLLNLLRKTAKDSVVQQFNSKGQNLLHILAMHGGSASFEQLHDIYTQFIRRGVKHMSIDIYGRSALHYAIIKRNLSIVNILLNSGYDPKKVDETGNTPITLLTHGNGILEAGQILSELLLAGADLNVLYEENYYAKKEWIFTKTGPEEITQPEEPYKTTIFFQMFLPFSIAF